MRRTVYTAVGSGAEIAIGVIESAYRPDMSEEEAFARQVKFLTDGEVLKLLEGSPRMEKALKKARHLRVYSMDFVVFDDTYQAPVWHVVLKNWPLTNFFKREKPLSVEAVVEATRGKIISLAVYDMK